MDSHTFLQRCRASGLYYDLLLEAQEELSKRPVKQDDLTAQILSYIKSSAYGRRVINELHAHQRSKPEKDRPKKNGPFLLPNSSTPFGEPLAYLRQAQLNWDKKIIKGVNTTCTRLSISLSRRRSDGERLEFAERWRELSAVVKDAPNVQFIYAEKDFLEQLTSIRNPISLLFSHSGIAALQRTQVPGSANGQQANAKPVIAPTTSRSSSVDYSATASAETLEQAPVVTTMSAAGSTTPSSNAEAANKSAEPLNVNPFLLSFSLIQVPLRVKSLFQLRELFAELSLTRTQIGVEDECDAQGFGQDAFIFQQEKLANTIVSSEMCAVIREHLKSGASVSYRGKMWQMLLLQRTELDEIDHFYYDQLRHCVCEYDMFVDTLYIKDVKANPGNDDRYFVFEDYLYQVLLPFARDTFVLEKLQELKEKARFNHNAPNGTLTHMTTQAQREQPALTYPPNGIIPFYGFSMYVVPMCYLYEEPVTLYYVFREFYIRYFAKLHCCGSDDQGIIGICVLFEQLLHTKEPALVYHLKQIGVEPLRIAFPWLMRAFLGFLTSKETLLLWDRILAFDTLEVLAVLAVGIFMFRKQNLLQARSPGVVDAIFSEMRTLQIVPILQLTLFGS